MSTRTTIIIFLAVFSIGVLLIVVLPFFLAEGPADTGSTAKIEEPKKEDKKAAELKTQGIFRSDDGGATWHQATFVEGEAGTIAGVRVNKLIPDPLDNETLYLATDGNGLWVTHSRGDLWAHVIDASGALDPNSNVLDVAVNPDNRDEWYVAVFQKNRGRVLASDNGGKSFREIYFTPLERFGVFAVYFDRAKSSVVIATGQGGLLETTDRGRTWRVVRWFADGLIRLFVDPANPAVRFLTTPRGSIFRTTDGGASWRDISGALDNFSGARANQVWFVDRGGTLYLGSSHGLLRSRDNGTTFAEPPLIIPPNALPVLAVAVAPKDTSRIFVAANGELYSSDDGGASWAIILPPSAKKTKGLLIDPKDANVIYAVAQP